MGFEPHLSIFPEASVVMITHISKLLYVTPVLCLLFPHTLSYVHEKAAELVLWVVGRSFILQGKGQLKELLRGCAVPFLLATCTICCSCVFVQL